VVGTKSYSGWDAFVKQNEERVKNSGQYSVFFMISRIVNKMCLGFKYSVKKYMISRFISFIKIIFISEDF
jgi:hypothetical protein